MVKTILILGAGVMQGPAIKRAKARGWRTIVVDGDPTACNAALADRFECIDLKDKEALLAFADSLQALDRLSGILTAGTDFSSSVAFLAEKLGLPGLPYETALDASDKVRMRRRFRSAAVPSPDFFELTAVPASDWRLPFACPLVVKPVDNMGARGCRRVDTQAQLATAVAEALSFSAAGRVIVEQYMEGPEYSIDALVYGGKIDIHGVADRHIFFPPYFIEMGHTMPTELAPDQLAALIKVFKAGVRALGITNGAAKGDVKLTPNGPMIGEIAARLSGGYMSGWTYPYAYGIEVTDGALSIAVGDPPGLAPATRQWTSAERAFISIPGTVDRVLMAEAAQSIPGVKDLFLRVSSGSVVGFPENNVGKCGNLISATAQRAEAIAAAEKAARRVLIALRYPNPATEAFLALDPYPSDTFPPPAFQLAAAGYQALKALPKSFLGPLKAELLVIPYPELMNSSLRDYQGRDPVACLEAVSQLVGCRLRLAAASEVAPLGQEFWRALVRGSYQGAAYWLESYRQGLIL